MSEIISTHRIPPEKLYVHLGRFADSAQKRIKADKRLVERMKLSPVQTKLFHLGPEDLIAYLRPQKAYDSKKHPDWSGLQVDDESGEFSGIVTVRKNAELLLGTKKRQPDVLQCTIVDAFSVSDEQAALSGLYKVGLQVATSIGGDLPNVAVEKLQTSVNSQRTAWLRRGDRSSDDFPEVSHEESVASMAMGRRVFTGYILRDDMNGFLRGAQFGQVFSDVENPVLTARD